MLYLSCFFFNDTATTEIYTLSLHDALPIYKLLKSIDDEKFSDISITIMCLFGIIVYCIIISLFINMATAEFLATHKKIISLILYICLIGTYMFNMQILYTLTIYRSQIIKKNTEKSQFLNFCALAVFVIICFTCIFISTNLLLWYNDPSNFKNSSSDPYDIFDIIYYSISTFLTFCAENINANTVLSKLTCLLSKITTIISITVLLSVVTGSLPDNKNTDEECKTDKKDTKSESILKILKAKIGRASCR